MKPLSYILAVVILTLTACTDTLDTFFGGGIEEGDAVAFTTLVPDVRHDTRSAKEEWQREVSAYKAVNREYTFDIEMWKEGDLTASAQGTYCPIVDDGEHFHSDGTLQNVATPLYWQDNVSHWGFRATAGTTTLAADQTDQAKWLAQDRLVGYSYLPIWTGGDDDGSPTDKFDAINYRTSKQWYADNKTAKDLSGLMVESNDDYKKVPLFLQHQRSWLTIILKAGEGVEREALAFATSDKNIKTTLYSYPSGGGEALPIDAWSSEERIDYVADKNGPAATGVSTTRYDAIVEPHNFIASATSQEQDIIARIHLSDQKFTFAAANDFRYGDFLAGDSEATEAMQAYNLLPGKHLTITATLSRGSRLILITAWIEDWTETVTQTICDDYGQNGNPHMINNRYELDQFLRDPEANKEGEVGIIVPGAISLIDTTWTASDYTLNATLNLAGATISVKNRLLNAIGKRGSVVNGVIAVDDTFHDTSALAATNSGTIDRVNVTVDDEMTPARASVAGLVSVNYGIISQCSSALPVYGTTGYVGGIAAQNVSSDNSNPTIDGCTVTARVDGSESVTAGGGIVGLAEGRVTNNTFDYGITLLQGHQYYNIIGAKGTGELTHSSNNSWPTSDRYTIAGTSIELVNNYPTPRYNAVIDCSAELKQLLTSPYNQSANLYRIAKGFEVAKESWIWGTHTLKDDYFVTNLSDDYAHGAVKFSLNGNNKTIMLTGEEGYATMLFGCVVGKVFDLNLDLAKPLQADRIMSDKGDTNSDAIAAFAYSVTVAGSAAGSIRNISLKTSNDSWIEASTPGGIAVWASHGGELINCVSNVPVRMHLTVEGFDARHYAGGIVACAQKATMTLCKYYGDEGSIGWADGEDGLDAPKAQKSNCRYGGIVGGTTEIAGTSEVPHLVLNDCSSWWKLPTYGDDVPPENRPRMGSLIGSTVYHDPSDNTRLFNAMADGNSGNWWVGTQGVGLLKTDVTEEQAIGRKNSIVPTKPVGW